MVSFEWVIEGVDEFGDIQDVNHTDSLKKALEVAEIVKTEWPRVEIGLVRDRGDEIDGLQDRQWAYLTDGVLPTKFDGGAQVPKRFLEAVV